MSPPTSGRKGPTRAAKKAANSSYYTSAVSENEPTIDMVTASPPSTDTGDTGDTADVSVIVKRKMVELAEDELPKKKKKSSGAIKPGKTTTTINSTPYYKSQQADKPDPLGSPDIWATTRQALCETVFPWYNSHQAGAYRKDGLVHGLMCDQETDVRDRLDHQILITRVSVILKRLLTYADIFVAGVVDLKMLTATKSRRRTKIRPASHRISSTP